MTKARHNQTLTAGHFLTTEFAFITIRKYVLDTELKVLHYSEK
jgi:hypothetical protein